MDLSSASANIINFLTSAIRMKRILKALHSSKKQSKRSPYVLFVLQDCYFSGALHFGTTARGAIT